MTADEIEALYRQGFADIYYAPHGEEFGDGELSTEGLMEIPEFLIFWQLIALSEGQYR